MASVNNAVVRRRPAHLLTCSPHRYDSVAGAQHIELSA
jgi:hypothetical protein